jgi:hypothetical protein
MEFDQCIIENSQSYGLYYHRGYAVGAKNTIFRSCWFEGMGLDATVPSACALYLDMADVGVGALKWTSSLCFEDCLISSEATAYDVFLNRGNDILFNRCVFSAFTAAKLHYEPGTGYAFATLKQCTLPDLAASPTVYTAFPALTLGGSPTGKIAQGFKYEYLYQGYPYSNIKKSGFLHYNNAPLANITNVTGDGTPFTTATFGLSDAGVIINNDGGDFDGSGRYTAPGPGTYAFEVAFPVTGMDVGMTSVTIGFNVELAAGGTQPYTVMYKTISHIAADYETFGGSIQLNLLTGDKVLGTITISGGTKVADIYMGTAIYHFSGRQL